MLQVDVVSFATNSSRFVIRTVWSMMSFASSELDSLSLCIYSCCLVWVSTMAARLVEWFARVVEWLLMVSACFVLFACATRICSWIEESKASILSS